MRVAHGMRAVIIAKSGDTVVDSVIGDAQTYRWLARQRPISIPPDPSSLSAVCSRAVEALLADREDHGSVASRAEQAIEQLMRQLARLVGDHGIRTLFRRSLSLASAEFPWLAITAEEAPGAVSPAVALRIALQSESPDVARHAFGVLLTTFLGLLARLIGEPLVRSMLQEVWPEVFRSEKESP